MVKLELKAPPVSPPLQVFIELSLLHSIAVFALGILGYGVG